MPEIIHDSTNLSGRDVHEFPGTATVKILYDDPQTKGKTLLLRVPAGGHLDPRTHGAPVHHYVLEGAYKTQGKVLEAGTYRRLPKYQDVSPISTQRGAVILMIYEPIESA